ncbi:hypothetical protein GPJ56_010774 [Histomonas meleagridis]|uniref:uncharacterized protein n=1 Tax=Histomonas meleagridis TaxID=135588 RepID=UPI0035594FE9|nr:hypothetical protein GPJ56_010774 [Histomonas meleagridis]KAH0801111.1 hypothetical protein GO595_006146 [Histomonas meleagridis]
MKEFERQQKELFEEALRVFDLSFLLFDYYRSSISAYQSMLNQQELSISQYECNSNEQDETVLETTNSVSSEPLPTCWQQEEDSSSGDEQSIWEECLFAKPNFELDSSN